MTLFRRDDACWLVPYQKGVVFFAGRGTELRPQDALVLAALIAKRGELATIEYLYSTAWPDGISQYGKEPDDPVSLLQHIIWRLRKVIPKHLITIKPVTKPTGRTGGGTLIGWMLTGNIQFKAAQ